MSTNSIANGGAAFPAMGQDWSAEKQCFELPSTQGMTLRDYFAAKSLQAQHTAFSALESWHGWTDDEMAADAYQKADAMIKARGV